VESTYNWYWIVDGLMEKGYKVHLANPSAIQQYSGLKHSDDKHDAFWLAEMLRLGILPEGYIYPREERPLRDLLRKRGHLVRLRTSLVNSLQNILSRNLGKRVNANDVKALREDRVSLLLEMNEDLALAGRVSKEAIDHLTRQIRKIEGVVEKRIKLKEEYRYLLTLHGVGKILSLTIMLETGPISRFPTVGDYVSYCRKVPSQWTSNGKRKGSGNPKNGNKGLLFGVSCLHYSLPSLFSCSGVLPSSHSLQMFFHPTRRHALNLPRRIRNNVNHLQKLTYLYHKFNFMAISGWYRVRKQQAGFSKQ
jgi:transposase